MAATTFKALAINSEHRLRSENLAFDIDVWYPRLEGRTPRSVFTPLLRTEAEAILHFQQTRYLSRATLTDSDLRVLRGLEKRLDGVLKSSGAFPGGAMLRLCGRSPKDGDPLLRKAIAERYRQELDKLVKVQGEPLTPNTKLRAIAKVPFMRVSSGKEAMCMLLSSERVFAECRDWLEYGEPEQVVFREWIDDMSLDYEFRVYVSHGRITAISQYDHYSVYPHLLKEKDHLERLIHAAWADAHPLIGEDAYVVDFAYLPHSDTMVLIELSPLLPCTGAALFSWSAEGDQLRNGPYEFRLNLAQRYSDELDDVIETNWVERWQKEPDAFEEWLLSEAVPPVPSMIAALSLRRVGLAGLAGAACLTSLMYLNSDLKTRALFGALAFAAGVPPIVAFIRDFKAKSRGESPLTLLFVYGTLKRGFHWHTKFLSFAEPLGAARTVDAHPLVVGACGVPYLLDAQQGSGLCIRGEVYSVDTVSLRGLDEYEGVGKGYYSRREIQVRLEGSARVVTAQVYYLCDPPAHLQRLVPVDEYTLDMHYKHYNAIRHIRVKQELYLGEDPDFKRT